MTQLCVRFVVVVLRVQMLHTSLSAVVDCDLNFFQTPSSVVIVVTTDHIWAVHLAVFVNKSPETLGFSLEVCPTGTSMPLTIT